MRRRRTFWSTVLPLLILCGSPGAGDLWPMARSRALAEGNRAFSAQERRDLDAGKLVTRPETRTVGDAHWIGGLSWQVIDADVTEVWAILADVTTYAGFLPAVSEARRVATLARGQRVFIRHRYSIVNASYCIVMTHDQPHGLMQFRLDHSQPGALADAYGELRVTALGPGRSVVSLAIMVDLGEGLVASLVRSDVHKWMLRVPRELKRFLAQRMLEAARSPLRTSGPRPASR